MGDQRTAGWSFILPYLIFVGIVFAYPIGYAIYMATHDFFFTAPGVDVPHPFVGFQNFITVLTDPQVQRSFLNIGIYLVINVPLTVALSLILASALSRAMRWRIFLRVSFYVPYVTAAVAVIAVWLFLFSQDGLVNHVMGPLAPDPSWLINGALAMPMIALFVTWKQLGFYILLYLAALQAIPTSLYEAAQTDGAGAVRRFFSVTVPGVRPATALVLIVSTLTGANLFTEPYLLTGGGGPNGASTTPVLIMYQQGIEQGKPDIAAALGLILVVGTLIVAVIQERLVGRSRQ
jgi:multiple sugar transport system permease protein